MNKKLVFVLFICVVISSVLITSNASAASSVKRLMGNDRYKTAVSVSLEGWKDGSLYAVLATGENFPDALSAVPLAKKYNAPILLTQKDELNIDTAIELKRLKVKYVNIIGGTGVISQNVETGLKQMGIIPTRIAGEDRYETSAKVADKVGIGNGIFVVSGSDFFDALCVAPVAARKGMPVILVPNDEIPKSIKKFTAGRKGTTTYIINGNGYMGSNVVSQFSNGEVIGGSDKYERNINIIKKFSGDTDFSAIFVATSREFADALSGAALAAKESSPLVFTDGWTISSPIRDFVKSKAIREIKILGGYGAVGSSAEDSIVSLPAGILSVYNISDTAAEGGKYDFPKTVTILKSDYTKEEVPVEWNLSSVNTSKSGTYTYEGTVKGYGSKVVLSLKITPSVASIENITAEVVQGGTFLFPSTAIISLSDGTTEEKSVTWNSQIVNTSEIKSYSFDGTIEEYNKKVTLTLNVVADRTITFSDYNLERVIRKAIGKTNYSSSIYKSDLLNIASLYARSESIYNLSGIEELTNLKSVDLGYNSISSISYLGRIKGLNTLRLNNNYISDLTPLGGLAKLKYLDLCSNSVTNITPLESLTGLTTLYLYGNSISDYSPVRPFYHNLNGRDFNL